MHLTSFNKGVSRQQFSLDEGDPVHSSFSSVRSFGGSSTTSGGFGADATMGDAKPDATFCSGASFSIEDTWEISARSKDIPWSSERCSLALRFGGSSTTSGDPRPKESLVKLRSVSLVKLRSGDRFGVVLDDAAFNCVIDGTF